MTTLDPQRRGMTTASQAPLIINGSAAQLFTLWQERTGQVEPEDLTNVFPVQWGAYCEPFVLDWIERGTQCEITERQRFVKHPTLPHIGATLDGYRPFDDAVVECKVLSPFTRSDEFIPYYAPQVVVQIACRQCARGYLAVQQGNSPPALFEINITPDYVNDIMAAIAAFHLCVATNTPPGPPPPAPIPPEQWRSFDLADRPLPNWGHAMMPALRLWSDTRPTWGMHEQSKKDVKALLPDDVGRVHHGTITVRRSRNGAVTITEEETSQ